MTREEFEQIVSETRLGSINTFYDDNMRNLLEEVYHAGFQDGYSNAIFKLQLFEGRSILAAADKEFFEKNGDKIRRRIEAIKEFEAESYSKLKIPESQEELDACNDEISEMFYGDDTDEYGLSKRE